jgi:hypothetical protein
VDRGSPADRSSCGRRSRRRARRDRSRLMGRRCRRGLPPRPVHRASRRSSPGGGASRSDLPASRSRSSSLRSAPFPRTTRHLLPAPAPARLPAHRCPPRGAGLRRRGGLGRTETGGGPDRRPATSTHRPWTQETKARTEAQSRVAARVVTSSVASFENRKDRSSGLPLLSILATKYGGRARCARHRSGARRAPQPVVAAVPRRQARSRPAWQRPHPPRARRARARS